MLFLYLPVPLCFLIAISFRFSSRPILHRTHGDSQLCTHLVHRRPALTTTTGAADQVSVDLERVHIQRHIEYGVGEHQELLLRRGIALHSIPSACAFIHSMSLSRGMTTRLPIRIAGKDSLCASSYTLDLEILKTAAASRALRVRGSSSILLYVDFKQFPP